MTYLILLRLFHITCGVFWAGATIYLAAFVAPAVQAVGPDGVKFMQQLARTNKLPLVMMLAATLNVLSGILLIWELSGGLQPEWMGSPHGIILSTGGTLAIIAYIIGLAVSRPTIEKIAKLGASIAKAGAPPSAEQSQTLAGYRKKLFTANKVVATLLAFTVIGMSIVRYF
jgi:hypothetical protein